jgi:hypothetical protein
MRTSQRPKAISQKRIVTAFVALGSWVLASGFWLHTDQTPVRLANALAKPTLSPTLAQTLDPVIDEMWSKFDVAASVAHVQFVNQYWRLPGNPGFDASIDRIKDALTKSGNLFLPAELPAAASVPGRIKVDEYQSASAHGWDYTEGTLAIVRDGQPDEVVLSKARERLALCINSFWTDPRSNGVVASLVDVGNGAQETDYTGKDVTGAVVLGDADVGTLWRRAVMAHGAIGVISTTLPRYINPNPPGAKDTPRETWDILQWGSIPYDETKHGFGFKATPRAAATLRAEVRRADLQVRPPKVRVTIKSSFIQNPVVRTLIAEIPGRTLPDERIVIAAHVQEPGANDNASGVATLAELARALALGIKQGRIPPPARTITMLWVDEIGGSRQWLRDHAEEAKKVKYMFSMDMVGGDVTKTGGTFLIERWPDPGAVFDRPWDPHTEWGRGSIRADQLKGDLLNDIHLAICERVARKSGWDVHTNPYEGGSDHTVFGSAGIPSVLDWHFTDRYYHTNLDTADKVSGPEMRNVATAVAASAWLLASADEPTTLAVAELVAAAGKTRITLEETEGAKLTTGQTQTQIVQAWKKWYSEAVRSASRLIVGPASEAFTKRLDALAATFGT